MNYAWVRDMALKLIDQYSVAGELVAPSYNNQTDYLLKIPALVNDGLSLLFTGYRPVRALAPVDGLARVRVGGSNAFVLPEDLWQLCGSGLVAVTEDGLTCRYSGYRILGENLLVIDSGAPAALLVEYYRRPALLGADPADDEELDGTQEMHTALPYYVAAHLAMHDSPFVYQSLCNEFEARARKLVQAPRTELGCVEETYAFREGDAGCM